MLTTPARIEGNTFSSKGGHSREQVVSSLLFWDQIVYASNSVIGFGSDEIDALKELGVAQEVSALVSGTPRDAVLLSERFVFDKLWDSSPGRWSISQEADTGIIDAENRVKNSGATMTLYGAIPIPPHEVAYEDVLEFRLRRRDELLALRFHIDELATKISNSIQSESDLASAVDQLDHAVSAQIKVTHEGFDLFRFVKFSPSFSLSDAAKEVIAKGIPASIAAFAATGSLPAAAAAAAIPGLKSGISLDLGLDGFKKAKAGLPFSYVVNAHRELP